MQQKRFYIETFPGMNNVQRQSPVTMIHNMDVTTDGKVVARDGYQLFLSLPGAHSLAASGEDLFCLAEGSTSLESFYRVSHGEAKEICPVAGKGYPLSYVITPNCIYLSSRVWKGIYEYATDSVREWGTTYSDDPSDLDGHLSDEWMTLNVTPPPFLENLCQAGGRIWGSRDERVHYNDPPFAYEMFRPDTFLSFNAEVTMIARSTAGMYFATLTDTYFGGGVDPERMTMVRVGDGALPGSLQYIPNFRGSTDVPMWTGKHGMYVGMSGIVLPLTNEKLKFNAGGRVASLYREKEGALQYLSSSPADGSFSDTVTCEVVRKGTLT